MNKIMQITAFKAILARRINIRGCEDYKITFARIDPDCTLRFGFKALTKSTHPLMLILRAKITLNAVICMILFIFSLIMES